jgi:hypothetical protein
MRWVEPKTSAQRLRHRLIRMSAARPFVRL